MITTASILTLAPAHPTAQVTAAKLQNAAVLFGITDPRSQAALLANCFVESGLVAVRENLYYTTPSRLAAVYPSKFAPGAGHDPAQYVRNPQALANLVYAYRLGNGSPESGDSWNFRGGCYPQLTGRANFAAAERLIGQPLTDQPALIDQIGISALVACAYWSRMSSANACAVRGDIVGTRRAVNGAAMLGLNDMLAAYRKVLPKVAI
ncbi:hypothetical protein GCM10022631_08700 [Deinococcus rubellus]|uniref:Glycoside hydrolase family 19 protein n=1 Tax=Deinococcus rubellus TaxID=1889240 RepID=A0ABY5YKA8_9DEIO|nr:hypothetical protein [Deinococcus rubellus]UWX64208.1 hypothetical protein N0D28_00580 [Deinococcus rubellus]